MYKKIIVNALATLLLSGPATHAFADDLSYEPGPGQEKCYGVSKAGRNDCGTGSYKCAGEAKVDGDPQAWINMPTGLCNRLVHGSTKPPGTNKASG